MIRPARPDETEALVSLACKTGLFSPEEAASLLGDTLTRIHANQLPPLHQALVLESRDTHAVQGWVYLGPTEHADNVWDLWWIGVDPGCQGMGCGKQLLEYVEGVVREKGGRMLVIETSSLDALVRTRRFYELRGYAKCGQIPNFYSLGDDKVIFVKQLQE
ncbi:hypothetical protein HDU98_000573 [Podochytrium sp. JEL0797]|nr:hypothetical protein HDU98_000573 [Podochytrium sp. JEL0797]